MPTILAIETSIPSASMALQLPNNDVHIEEFESHRQQNKLLFPSLEKLLKHKGNYTIDLIIVGTGPGSYSGSRIAIAAAQGLGVAYQCPVVGLCSFLATETMQKNQKAFAIGDARRGSFFITEVNQHSSEFKPELLEEAAFNEKLLALNSPLFSFEESISSTEQTYHFDSPSAPLLISAWQKLSSEDQEKLKNTLPQPAYLRAPFVSKAKPGHPLLRKK